MKFRILDEAEQEIEAARVYLNRQSSGLGARFLDDLDAALITIRKAPFDLSKLETLPDDQPYRRALLKVFRYAVIFEVLDDEMLVVAVTHMSRAPNYWIKRRD